MGLLTVLGVVLTVGCALAIVIVLELKAGDISTVTFTARLPLLASAPRVVLSTVPVQHRDVRGVGDGTGLVLASKCLEQGRFA